MYLHWICNIFIKLCLLHHLIDKYIKAFACIVCFSEIIARRNANVFWLGGDRIICLECPEIFVHLGFGQCVMNYHKRGRND